MPLHDHRCILCGQVEERFIPIDRLGDIQWHDCAHKVRGQMLRVFLQAPMGFVQRDICYDSPVDGRAITTKAARLDDLRRNDCVEYEPGMRQDAERKKRESEAQLDRAVDSSVEQFIASAPVRKVEKLEQELRAGAAVEVTRASPALTN